MNNLYVPTTGNQIQFINILKIYDNTTFLSSHKLNCRTSHLGTSTAFIAVQMHNDNILKQIADRMFHQVLTFYTFIPGKCLVLCEVQY